VDVVVCSSAAAERVRQLAAPAVQVMIDDRALDQRAIQTLAVVLVQQNGGGTAAKPPTGQRRRPDARRPAQSARGAAGRTK
jgi:hypothetical protein